MKKLSLTLATLFAAISMSTMAAPVLMTDTEMNHTVAGNADRWAGFGNHTATRVGSANLQESFSSSQNFYGSLAEYQNDQMSITSDVGEGRERADEVNGKNKLSWATR